MKLILNEKNKLEESLNNGYVDINKPSNTIRILIKYYFSIGMNKPQVIDSIDKFFSKHMKNYNSIKWQRLIENMTNYVYKGKDYSLLNITKVEITENELKTIEKLNNIKFEKLAFTLLVYAKIYNQMNNTDENWVNEEHKYIFSDAKVAVTIKEQGKMIHNLKELGFVESSVMVNSTNIKVNFADLDSPIVLTVGDFRNFIYVYLRWKGENIKSCEKCNILIIPSNNCQKYCKDCAKMIKYSKVASMNKRRREEKAK